jgi:hypothetical protein
MLLIYAGCISVHFAKNFHLSGYINEIPTHKVLANFNFRWNLYFKRFAAYSKPRLYWTSDYGLKNKRAERVKFNYLLIPSFTGNRSTCVAVLMFRNH